MWGSTLVAGLGGLSKGLSDVGTGPALSSSYGRAMALADVIRQALDLGLSQTYVAIPGKVVSYNHSTGRADVKPGVTRREPASAPGAEDTYAALPEIPSVPVLWLGGGSFGAHAPLAAGDKVLLLCCDGDPFPFLRTGEISDPQDVREHDLAHAVAIPVFRVPGHAATDGMTLGHDSAPLKLKSTGAEIAGNTDAAALASKVDQIGQAIGVLASATTLPTALTAINGVLTAFQSVFPAGVGSVASTKLKVGG